MPTLMFRDIKLRRDGFAGVKILYMDETLCIDVANPEGCTHILYTHSHPRHYREGLINETLKPSIYSPFTGNIVKPGESHSIGHFRVDVVHSYNRTIHGEPVHPKGLGVGYIVTTGNTVVYHTGDSDFIDEMLELREKEIDILLIPIEGFSVMGVEEASEAVKSLRPSITVPIHFTEASSFYRFRDIVYHYTQVILLR